MKTLRLSSAVLALLILGISVPAQQIAGKHRKVFSGGGNTWTLVQTKFWDSGSVGTGGGTCSSTATTCNVTVASVGAGHLLLCVGMYSNSSQLNLSAGCGTETWSHCAGANGCSFFDGANAVKIGLDASYVLSATGSETSFTCTLSAVAGGFNACAVLEYSWSGATKTFDTSNGGISSNCTSCSGQALTIGGSKDAIVQVGLPLQNLTSIAGGAGYSGSFFDGVGFGSAVNTTTGTAPTWTQSPIGDVVVMAIAFSGS